MLRNSLTFLGWDELLRAPWNKINFAMMWGAIKSLDSDIPFLLPEGSMRLEHSSNSYIQDLPKANSFKRKKIISWADAFVSSEPNTSIFVIPQFVGQIVHNFSKYLVPWILLLILLLFINVKVILIHQLYIIQAQSPIEGLGHHWLWQLLLCRWKLTWKVTIIDNIIQELNRAGKPYAL